MDFKRKMITEKRSQTTMFIIMAIIIVAGIALFFLLKGTQIIDIIRPSMPEPQGYIEKCARDSALEVIDIMLPQGGFISPDNYKMYRDEKVGYLCYTNKYYYSCIMQEPLYIEHLEQEIENYIQPKIEDCFYSLRKDYEKKQYKVDAGLLSLDVKLAPKQAKIEINKRFEVSKEEARRYDKFEVKLNSPLYDLAIVAQEIASQEAKYCYFEYLGYSLLYPLFSIEKYNVGSEETASKIYTIKDKITGKELWIAIRSCAMPGGL